MRKNLLKTLLVAIGLVMGVNVWADEITATLVHTASSYCGDNANVFTSTVDAENEHINNNKFNSKYAGAAYAEFSFTIPEGQTIQSATLTFTGLGESRNPRNTDVMYVSANASLDYDALNSGNTKVDLSATKITSVTFPKGATATTKFEIDAADAVKAMLEATKGSIIFKFTNNPGGGDLKGKGSDAAPSLVITTASASQQTSYTVKFTDGTGNELKDAVTYDILKGEQATASAADMASFFNTDYTMKYIYASGNETITATENAENNVITLVFREADKFKYTVKSSLGTTLVTGSDWEGQTMYINYPRYLAQDGTLYYINKNSSGGWFQKTFTLTQDNQEETINYTAGSKGVVYLAEAENIETLTVSTAANSAIRCSNGSCAYNAGENDVVITNLPAGKYKLYTSAWGAAGTEFVFKAGENKIKSTYKCLEKNEPVPGSDGLFTSKGYIIDYESEEITLLSETDITLGATTDGSRGIDFIYIIKTGDATETVSVTDAGLATYCPSYGLDFTNAENIEAYKATVDAGESTVILTKVNTVAAGEGVLLRSIAGDAATENIPVAADAQKNDGNDFVGVETDIESLATETDGHTNYILNNVDGVIGFYKAAGKSVAAGKAYLQVPTTAANAKSLKIVFGDTTGISEINNTAKADGAYYSISGVRVANPTKGLYIQNGKKVIVK
ncbi:MAG: hypothetical protein J6K19_05570 [Prevotella sp.]|nr:hypothetical protein [Prevotella sp.]